MCNKNGTVVLFMRTKHEKNGFFNLLKYMDISQKIIAFYSGIQIALELS